MNRRSQSLRACRQIDDGGPEVLDRADHFHELLEIRGFGHEAIGVQVASGMDGYVSKPILAAELFCAIGEALTTTGSPGLRVTADEPAAEVFDQATSLERTGGNEQLLGEMAVLFAAECPKHLREIREAIARQDAAVVQRAAYALRGSGKQLLRSRGGGGGGRAGRHRAGGCAGRRSRGLQISGNGTAASKAGANKADRGQADRFSVRRTSDRLIGAETEPGVCGPPGPLQRLGGTAPPAGRGR